MGGSLLTAAIPSLVWGQKAPSTLLWGKGCAPPLPSKRTGSSVGSGCCVGPGCGVGPWGVCAQCQLHPSALQNIELKVEVESLKRELQEKQQALDKTW